MVQYQTHDRSYLFLLEVTMGLNAKRVIEQLYAHIQALEEGTASHTFNVDHGHFVGCLFEYKSCMKAVIQHMKKDKKLHPSLKKHFLFACLEEPEKSFCDLSWYLWDWNEQSFYGL